MAKQSQISPVGIQTWQCDIVGPPNKKYHWVIHPFNVDTHWLALASGMMLWSLWCRDLKSTWHWVLRLAYEWAPSSLLEDDRPHQEESVFSSPLLANCLLAARCMCHLRPSSPWMSHQLTSNAPVSPGGWAAMPSWPQNIITGRFFKPLRFGVFCYLAIVAWYIHIFRKEKLWLLMDFWRHLISSKRIT